VGSFAAYVVTCEIATDGPVLERSGGAAGVEALAVGLAITAGSFATAAVVGMRAYTISKIGLSVIDVLALPALLGGLVLLPLEARLVLGPIGRWRSLLAIPAGLALVYYLIMPVAIGLMLTHVPRTEVGGASPADLASATRTRTSPRPTA
jgi:ABC-type tungstate transport system substrate-binding protein